MLVLLVELSSTKLKMVINEMFTFGKLYQAIQVSNV
jgi:hypothetical protein